MALPELDTVVPYAYDETLNCTYRYVLKVICGDFANKEKH